MDCYVLDNEARILSATSILEAFGRTNRGLSINEQQEIMNILDKNLPHHSMRKIPAFLGSKVLASLITTEFLTYAEQIEYTDGNNIILGYRAELLPALCSLYLEARRQGLLITSQKKFANQAEIFTITVLISTNRQFL